MRIEQEELETLMPHRGKMMLLDRVIDYDINNNIRAEYDITESCLFYDHAMQGVPSWVGFEFMAQAISVLTGLRSREKGEKPKIGFILSVPLMQMSLPVFELGSLADIRVRENDCTNSIYTFEGEIFINDKKAVEGKLMVMEVEDEEKFITMMKESD